MNAITVNKERINQAMLNLEKGLGGLKDKGYDIRYGDDCTPLKHTFGEGLYIREMTLPKGMLIVSKIHKTRHPYFILRGDCSVLTPEGVVRIKAPHSGMTEPGTKRVAYAHEETVWVTVHATKEKDLKKIEKELIAETFNDIPFIEMRN